MQRRTSPTKQCTSDMRATRTSAEIWDVKEALKARSELRQIVAGDTLRSKTVPENHMLAFGCGCGVRTHSNLPADLKLPTQAAQPPRFELHCTRAHGHGHPVQEVYDINRDFDAKAQSNNAHCHLWSCQSTYPMRRSSGKPAAECADGRDTCCNCKNVSARAFMKQCCMPQFLQTWKPPISTIVGGTNLQEQFRH